MEQDDQYHYIAQNGTQFKTDELFIYGNFFPFSIFRFPMTSVVNKTTDKKALLYSNYKMSVTFPQAKDKEVRGTKLVVTGLKEGAFYRFRVRAVNIAGIGEPGEVTDAIEIGRAHV